SGAFSFSGTQKERAGPKPCSKSFPGTNFLVFDEAWRRFSAQQVLPRLGPLCSIAAGCGPTQGHASPSLPSAASPCCKFHQSQCANACFFTGNPVSLRNLLAPLIPDPFEHASV